LSHQINPKAITATIPAGTLRVKGFRLGVKKPRTMAAPGEEVKAGKSWRAPERPLPSMTKSRMEEWKGRWPTPLMGTC